MGNGGRQARNGVQNATELEQDTAQWSQVGSRSCEMGVKCWGKPENGLEMV